MQHHWSRQVVPRLLADSGMGAQALAGGLAADLPEQLPASLIAALWSRAETLTPEPAAPWQGPLNQLPIPKTAHELLAQLAPVAIAHPADAGLSIALLVVLADLWPHVASEERPLMRVRFLNGLMERAAGVGTRGGLSREAVVTAAELKVWTRYMPTATGGSDGAVGLQRLLSAPTGQEAYHLFADHLIGDRDQRTIAHVLGSLALQLADEREDREGALLHLVAGAVAAERLAVICPPEHTAVLLSQLAHQLWWTAVLSGLPRRTDHGAGGDLATAITEGAAGTARLLARIGRHDAAGWWRVLEPAILAIADRGPAQTRRAVIATWSLATRSADRLMAPDDIAAAVALLADGAR